MTTQNARELFPENETELVFLVGKVLEKENTETQPPAGSFYYAYATPLTVFPVEERFLFIMEFLSIPRGPQEIAQWKHESTEFSKDPAVSTDYDLFYNDLEHKHKLLHRVSLHPKSVEDMQKMRAEFTGIVAIGEISYRGTHDEASTVKFEMSNEKEVIVSSLSLAAIDPARFGLSQKSDIAHSFEALIQQVGIVEGAALETVAERAVNFVYGVLALSATENVTLFCQR